MSSGPVVIIHLRGSKAVARVRKMLGGTDPSTAEPGSLRGVYGIDKTNNFMVGLCVLCTSHLHRLRASSQCGTDLSLSYLLVSHPACQRFGRFSPARAQAMAAFCGMMGAPTTSASPAHIGKQARAAARARCYQAPTAAQWQDRAHFRSKVVFVGIPGRRC
jgi:hypothetical protein